MDKKAFTIAETLIALMVAAVFIVVTITTLMNGEGRREKELLVRSQTAFYNAEQIYHDMLLNHTLKPGKLLTLKDVNNDGTVDSKDIRQVFAVAYTAESLEDCSKMKAPESFALVGAVCLDIAANGFFAFKLDKSCTTELKVVEFYGRPERNVTNSCGYIAYSTKDSKGEFAKDFFVYPMEKTSIEKKTPQKRTLK